MSLERRRTAFQPCITHMAGRTRDLRNLRIYIGKLFTAFIQNVMQRIKLP